MKYCELDKQSQDFLTDQLNDLINSKAEEENIEDFEYPTDEEYKEFFDEYDEDYEMNDGYPETTVDTKFHKKYSIEFKDKRVVLNTFDPDYDE